MVVGKWRAAMDEEATTVGMAAEGRTKSKEGRNSNGL
jgi:hypothetical protein